MLGSNSPSAWVTPMLRASFALVVLSVLSACSSSHLQLESTLPRPLIDRIELPVGVYMDEPFRTFSAAEEIPQHGTVSLSAGAINQELFNRVLPGLFTDVRTLDKPITDKPGADKPIADKPGADDVRAVFVPMMKALEFSLPSQSHNGNFEVRLLYQVRLQAPDGSVIADWPIIGYGKAPDEDLIPIGARERGLQAAANVALRDAGAALTLSLRDVPEIKRWLEVQLQPRPQ